MFSTFVTYIGCSSGPDVFQMPRRTQSPNVVCHNNELPHNMKQTIKLILILFAFTSQLAFGQQVDNKQVEVAKTFLDYVVRGEKENSWQLFDKANVPDVTKEQFEAAMNQFKSDLSFFDNFELTMNGIKFVGDKQLNQYTFKAISKTKNIVDEILVDILFFNSSKLVAGIQPKKLLKENPASTSRAKETPIEKEFTAVIDSVSYKVTGINIVHFANNEGLLAIQVEYLLPSDLDSRQKFAKKEAIKFVKFLIKNGYMDKAKLKAIEIDRKLLDDIGVSFLDPTKGGGFNVMVKADEYK